MEEENGVHLIFFCIVGVVFDSLFGLVVFGVVFVCVLL